MADSLARTLGRACRQLSDGDWSGAATTVKAGAWFGRYLGCFAALAIPVAALHAAVAWFVPDPPQPSGTYYLALLATGVAAPFVMLPMGIWLAWMTLGRFRLKLRATTLLGGVAEGAVIAIVGVAIWVLVGWISRLGTPARPL